MGEHIRRLVSGNKARHKDKDLDVELDLAYITDHVIVMGYPASGIEGLYRNRRQDAKRFLEHHHGKNFWVFNFCPVKENSYPASVFDGRVSRYPFPDHHAPPLVILPLVAREMRLWLDGSPDRIAVLHCKAGKGRSGTMACAYLLTLDVAPSAPRLQRSLTAKEKAKSRAEQVMNAMPADEAAAQDGTARTQQSDEDLVKLEFVETGGGSGSAAPATNTDAKTQTETKTTPARSDTVNSLSHVLDLHTARRMKRSTSPGTATAPAAATVKQGVSIPSQRRWLYYWSLVLAHQAPPGFWAEADGDLAPTPKVRLTQVRVRMHELSGLKGNLVRAANALLDGAGKGWEKEKAKKDGKTNKGGREGRSRSASEMWASLARYDDGLVEQLEGWERATRGDAGMGARRSYSKGAAAVYDDVDGEPFADTFKDGRWDSKKMVRSFARMGTLTDNDVRKEAADDGSRVETLVLRPLTGNRWQSIREKIESETLIQDAGKGEPQRQSQDDGGASRGGAGIEAEDTSLYDVIQTLKTDGGVVLDAHREVRMKLYIGQVFMGWFWFIPTFHMQHPRGTTAAENTTFVLTRKELDFPVGIGANIIDVAVSMEWCSEAADVISPPERVSSAEIEAGKGEPAGVIASLPAVATGEARELAEAKEAAKD